MTTFWVFCQFFQFLGKKKWNILTKFVFLNQLGQQTVFELKTGKIGLKFHIFVTFSHFLGQKRQNLGRNFYFSNQLGRIWTKNWKNVAKFSFFVTFYSAVWWISQNCWRNLYFSNRLGRILTKLKLKTGKIWQNFRFYCQIFQAYWLLFKKCLMNTWICAFCRGWCRRWPSRPFRKRRWSVQCGRRWSPRPIESSTWINKNVLEMNSKFKRKIIRGSKRGRLGWAASTWRRIRPRWARR